MSKQQIANQRVFDEALKHIRKQGRPSINAKGWCYYHRPNGLMCAFAPAIKDYDESLEGNAVDELLDKFSDALHEWARDASVFVCDDIQSAHDYNARLTGPEFVAAFERDMQTVASDYNLTYTEAE